jgi:hypothetical protein
MLLLRSSTARKTHKNLLLFNKIYDFNTSFLRVPQCGFILVSQQRGVWIVRENVMAIKVIIYVNRGCKIEVKLIPASFAVPYFLVSTLHLPVAV